MTVADAMTIGKSICSCKGELSKFSLIVKVLTQNAEIVEKVGEDFKEEKLLYLPI